MSRLSNLGEGIFRDVLDLKKKSSTATEKFPGSMQTRRSRVYGEFCPVLAAVWG